MVDISIKNFLVIYNSSNKYPNNENHNLLFGFRKKLLIELLSYIISNNNINIRKEVKIIKEIHILVPNEKKYKKL